jgi:hypothetical protein
MASTVRETNTTRSELARELNERIREIAAENGDDVYPYTFVCECGCWSEIRLTLPEYDAIDRVVRAGHSA